MITLIAFIIWVLSLLVALIESITYTGFIIKHFYFSPITLYVLYLIITILDKFVVNSKQGRISIIFFKVSKIFIILSILIYLILIFADMVIYDNFVFSTIHIQPESTIWLFYLSLTEFILQINLRDKEVRSKITTFFKFKTLVVILIALLFIGNLSKINLKMNKDIKFLISHPFASNDEKMEYKIGPLVYDYSKFIEANTPSDSKILLPPFPAYPWPQTGNAVYFRYFLYPRSLFSGEEYSPKIDFKDIDFVLIAWGETPTTSNGYTHGWPKFDVPAEYISFFNTDGSTFKINENYVYNKYKDKEVWGIIKVKK